MRILLSAYTGLGNLVLKTPLISAIKQHFPNAVIDLIAGNAFGTEHLLKNSAQIRKTHLLKQDAPLLEKISFFRQLRQENYEYIFLPFDANKNFLMWGSYIAGIPSRLRHKDAPINTPLDHVKMLLKKWRYPKTAFIDLAAGRHETQLNLDLLQHLYPKLSINKPPTYIKHDFNIATLLEWHLAPKQYLIIQMGAANGQYPAKVWAPENFVQLLPLLYQAHQLPIVLVGDKGDLQTSIQPILDQLPADIPLLINTAGKTSISQLMDLIDAAKLVICHDSGVMHIADALNTPLLALYGPTDHTRTKPLKPTSNILYSKGPHFNAMYHFGCTEAQLKAKGIGHEAMNGITVEQVLNAIREML